MSHAFAATTPSVPTLRRPAWRAAGVAVALIAASGCVTRTRGGGTVLVAPGFFVVGGNQDRDDDRLDPARIAAILVIAGVIAQRLQKVADDCSATARGAYAIDCLGEGYQRVGEEVGGDAALAEARERISTAGRRLSALARANRAAGVPDIRGPAGTRPLVPAAVSPELRAAAVAILEETETVLLRSGEDNPVLREPYRKIAAAFDSGKVLLRS